MTPSYKQSAAKIRRVADQLAESGFRSVLTSHGPGSNMRAGSTTPWSAPDAREEAETPGSCHV